MVKSQGISRLFTDRGKQESAGSINLLRAFKVKLVINSRSDHFHRRNQANVRASNGTLGTCHDDGGLRGGAAAVFLSAIQTNAFATRDANFLGYGFVTWNALFNGLIGTSAFGISSYIYFFSNHIIVAGLHLAGFSAKASSLIGDAEHRAARRESKGNSDKGSEEDKVFHVRLGLGSSVR